MPRKHHHRSRSWLPEVPDRPRPALQLQLQLLLVTVVVVVVLRQWLLVMVVVVVVLRQWLLVQWEAGCGVRPGMGRGVKRGVAPGAEGLDERNFRLIREAMGRHGSSKR